MIKNFQTAMASSSGKKRTSKGTRPSLSGTESLSSPDESHGAFFSVDPSAFIADLYNAVEVHLCDRMDELEKLVAQQTTNGAKAHEVHCSAITITITTIAAAAAT